LTWEIVATPMTPRTVLPTKLAVAEKHKVITLSE
jgi:hypothetical protein